MPAGGKPDVAFVPVEPNPMAYHFVSGVDPKNRDYFWSTTLPDPEPSPFLTDAQALSQGKVTVSALNYHMDNLEALSLIEKTVSL